MFFAHEKWIAFMQQRQQVLDFANIFFMWNTLTKHSIPKIWNYTRELLEGGYNKYNTNITRKEICNKQNAKD